MSQETFASIIGRAAVDRDFLEQLKNDPDSLFATVGDLNDEEKVALRALDPVELDALHAATEGSSLAAIVNKKDG